MNKPYLIPFSAFTALPTKQGVSSDADTFFESWNNRPFQLRQFLTEIAGVDGFGDITDVNREPIQDREAFTNLLIIEDKIRNEELFWSLFGYLFSLTDLNSVYIENIIEMVKRYDRHLVHLNKKQQWSNQIYNLGGLDNSKVRGILDKYNIENDITVYRGFTVRKDTGEQIRESNDKNDDEYLNQKAGLGLSYSLNKDVAIAFATRWTSMKPVIELLQERLEFKNRTKVVVKDLDNELVKIGILNWEETPISRFVELVQQNSDNKLIKLFQRLVKEGLENRHQRYEEFDSSYMGFGVRSVLGTYKVKKIDVLMPINLSNQNELVILPENAKLIRYDFLTSKQLFDAQGIHDFKEKRT